MKPKYLEALERLHTGENLSRNDLLVMWRDERNQLIRNYRILAKSTGTLARAFKKVLQKYVPDDVKEKGL